MNKKYWFPGIAYDANGQGDAVAVLAHTFDEASAKFFNKYEELAKDPKAIVDMLPPLFLDEWSEEDEDIDFIPLQTRLRKYFIFQ